MHAEDLTADAISRHLTLPPSDDSMDLGIVAALVMLVVWAVATLNNGPGWVHLLLTVGLFVLIWRISVVTIRRRGSKQSG
jgi:hypothetical protein